MLERGAGIILISLLVAGLVWWLAGLAAWRVSQRLEALAAAILAHPIAVPDHIPLDEGGDEIAILSRALRQALSAQEKARRELHQLAYYDPLTGLMNRSLFEAKLKERTQGRHRRGDRFALLFIDLDRFKVVNDTAGHEAGDFLLRDLAGRIRARVRASDLACRRSGDEFTLLMEPCVEEQDAALLAGDLIKILSQPCPLPTGASVSVGASIGIAFYPVDGTSAMELMANTDAAMYAAKEAGAGRYRFYADDAAHSIHDRLLMESALRQALDENRLELVYQPQIDLADGRLVGFEALSRWRDAHFGEVKPDIFIPLAEASGLIDRLSLWLLRRACGEMLSYAQGQQELILSFNISPNQVKPDFILRVREILTEIGWPPQRLELEMKESALMQAPPEVWVGLKELRALGISLSMDDFGSGYSSLGYLRHLSGGKLKIDPLLVQDQEEQEGASSLVDTIIALAHRMNLRVVAEGVEMQAQLDHLKHQGCDLAQGFLLGRPLSADRLGESRGLETL